ncbi:PadR family transcriptional regulator [Breoghania sp.]|uniref:PadR family transcriptional regulator n=1 Tax=Breoghania sp. TaxID=2065378 RepID=UPI002AAC327E|nr:PadR family transcriptional regulator [Breoghania sp.]
MQGRHGPHGGCCGHHGRGHGAGHGPGRGAGRGRDHACEEDQGRIFGSGPGCGGGGYGRGEHGFGENCGEGPQRRMRGGGRGRGFDEDFGPRGGGRPHGGRGRRRMFDGGELRLVLLKLISETPRHGYDLIRAIEERTSGAYAPSPGVVYPSLTMLAEMDLISEAPSEGARKLFAVTEAGAQHLVEQEPVVEALLKRLDAVSVMQERTDAVPVRRAMHNLREVIHNRLVAGVDEDKLHELVALIDEAAGKIERL